MSNRRKWITLATLLVCVFASLRASNINAGILFSQILSATNLNALVMGAAGTLASASTGVIESNRIRSYTVATLPASPVAGDFAYVTDGLNTTDCTGGGGSIKVTCIYNGTTWVPFATSGGGSTVTYGAIASRPAAGTAGREYVPSDSYYDALFDNGSTWTYRCFDGQTCTPPDSATFTAINTPTTAVQTNGGITISTAAAGGDNIRSYVQTAPATPYTRTYRIFLQLGYAQFGFAGVVFRESGTNKLITYGIQYSTNAPALLQGAGGQLLIANYTNNTTFSTVSIDDLMPTYLMASKYITLRISDAGGVAGNLTYAWSTDGINFTNRFAAARNTFFTTGPDQIGVFVNSNNATFATTLALVSVD